MSAKGEIRIKVLKDGRARIETGDMSGPAHKDADELIKFIQKMMGGPTEIEKKHDHGHHHHHEHEDQEHHHKH